MHPAEMIRQVQLFAQMNDEPLQAIARLLRPRLAVPAERIIRKGVRGGAMFFIAAGAVDVRDPVRDVRVSRGPEDSSVRSPCCTRRAGPRR